MLSGAKITGVLQALPLKCGILKLFANAFDADRLGAEGNVNCSVSAGKGY